MSRVKSGPHDSRSFRLATGDEGPYHEIRDMVFELTKTDCKRPKWKSLTLERILDKIKYVNINVFPDGQRGIVANFDWMKSFVTTVYKTEVIDPFLVNAVGDRFHVYKGKQRMSALFAFFTGLVPVEIDGVDYYYTDHRNSPLGWSYLSEKNNVNSNGKRESPHNPSDVLRLWVKKIMEANNIEARFMTEKRMILEKDDWEKIMAKELDFQILPEWPTKAVAIHVAWSEMNCFKHSGAECIYSLPGLGAFKEIEGSLSRMVVKYGIENDKKRAFCDILRAYMFLRDNDQFIPFSRDVENYGAIVCEIAADFTIRDKAPKKANMALKKLKDGGLFLYNNEKDLKPIKLFSSDTFACLLVLISMGNLNAKQWKEMIHIFKSSANVKREKLGLTNYHLWTKGEKEGDFSLVVKAVLAKFCP